MEKIQAIYNEEAERGVLSVIMSEENAIHYAQTILGPDSFYISSHRHLFEAVSSLASKSSPIDSGTISDELKRMGDFEEVGGLSFIGELTDYIPPFNHENHCRIVARDQKHRKLIGLLDKASAELSSGPVENEDELVALIAMIEKSLRDSAQQQSKYVDYKTAVDKMSEDAKEERGLLPGHPDLDRHIDLRPGQILTIYGETGHKKTTLALNFALNWARRVKVVYYSTEQRPKDLTKIARDIEGGESLIPEGNLTFVKNTPTIETLVPQVKMLKARYGLSVVFVDYLQDLNTNDPKRYGEETARISYFIQALKDLVLNENLAMVIISQMRKQMGESRTINPSIDRMRGSGDIKMASSIILSIVNPKKLGMEEIEHEKVTENMLVLRIKKNRDCLSGHPGEEKCIKVHNEPGGRKISALWSDEEEERELPYYAK